MKVLHTFSTTMDVNEVRLCHGAALRDSSEATPGGEQLDNGTAKRSPIGKRHDEEVGSTNGAPTDAGVDGDGDRDAGVDRDRDGDSTCQLVLGFYQLDESGAKRGGVGVGVHSRGWTGGSRWRDDEVGSVPASLSPEPTGHAVFRLAVGTDGNEVWSVTAAGTLDRRRLDRSSAYPSVDLSQAPECASSLHLLPHAYEVVVGWSSGHVTVEPTAGGGAASDDGSEQGEPMHGEAVWCARPLPATGPDVIYSGGDDAACRRWDRRTPQPSADRVARCDAGVTVIVPLHPTTGNTFALGSYDGSLTIRDVRMPQRALSSLHYTSGVWDLVATERDGGSDEHLVDLGVAATWSGFGHCTWDGTRLTRRDLQDSSDGTDKWRTAWAGDGEGKDVGAYNGGGWHNNVAYGIDYCATCRVYAGVSFYDRHVSLWSVE